VRQLLSGSTSPNAIVINLHANSGIDLSATDTLSSLVAEAEKTNTEIGKTRWSPTRSSNPHRLNICLTGS
jgi:hypothetical protein